METKLNIAEILKDKLIGTKLYTDAFGELSIEEIYTEDEIGITLLNRDEEKLLFYNDGKYNVHGEPILVPSKEMRDWSKFAWKKGDVLVNGDKNLHIIFEEFDDDTYISFKGKHYLWKEGDEEDYSKEEANMATSLFEKANDESAQAYIKVIEKRLGGKLSLTTLEMEPAQPEFKDGDILYAEKDEQHVPVIFILNITKKGRFYYACLTLGDYIICDYIGLGHIGNTKFRLATEEEKQLLFNALAKEGKAWDADKKQIVDLEPKWTPKTFDKVITRDFDDGVWSANIFSHMNSQGEYVSIGCVEGYAYCLPYNEETAKLIGTTNNAK